MIRSAIFDLAYSLRLPIAPISAWLDDAFHDAASASPLAILDRLCGDGFG